MRPKRRDLNTEFPEKKKERKKSKKKTAISSLDSEVRHIQASVSRKNVQILAMSVPRRVGTVLHAYIPTTQGTSHEKETWSKHINQSTSVPRFPLDQVVPTTRSQEKITRRRHT